MANIISRRFHSNESTGPRVATEVEPIYYWAIGEDCCEAFASQSLRSFFFSPHTDALQVKDGE